MKNEDKQLLLQDLCSRLPYGVKVSYYGSSEECECVDVVEGIYSNGEVIVGQYGLPIESVKPYLFPLSSMTEEQKIIYGDFCYAVIHSLAWDMQTELNDLIDWFNKNHFDYRGLIEKGLAIDATDKNIY